MENKDKIESEIVAPSYMYDHQTRALFPFALQGQYEEAGTWPENGFEVPASIADEYIQSERRAETEIVKNGDRFEIVDIA